MDAEVVIVTGYAVGLLLLAALIRKVGHASTDAWSSRMFAAYRAQAPVPLERAGADWPHAEAPRLYRVVGLVAVVAGLVLCLVEVLHHHRPQELAVEAVAIGVLAATLARWLRQEQQHQVHT
jgi:hypothetical protein